ncbi:hypothetical protein B0J13DRAFT_620621 [Dactylonectria estremocensis]|uniref:Uncharacterized protein n=1 Tax=Dactylonectria estremocensis TaxID=1079267 RepID=A0A9P9JBR6_9HYPO|nr:hypothetical protein B0J13DRAFT_620621 [Dactylonectria estremocensis]
MSVIDVFEDPWPGGRKKFPLEKEAVQHLELVEIFLKLLPHLQTDENGNIHDEALAYSEWRYMNYLRFLDVHGFAPSDHLPPYQSHNNSISYGLEHRHFPLTNLLSGEWSSKKTRRVWDAWNSPKGDRAGPELSYQLWPSPPWEARRRSSFFSRLLDRGPSIGHYEPRTHQDAQPERRVLMQWWNRCYLGHSDNLPAVWDIKAYTAVRTWQRDKRCRTQSNHEYFRQPCDLRPWPSVQDLRGDLERQIPFWRALVQTKCVKPGFVEGLPEATKDYEKFIGLFHGKISKAMVTQYMSIDPKMLQEYGQGVPVLGAGASPAVERHVLLVPPTLEEEKEKYKIKIVKIGAQFW